MIPAIVSATVSVHLAVVLCHFAARRSFTRARARGPLRPALGAEELTPFELAMLAGGRQRVGEVALAALFLGGRVVARGDGSVSRPAPEPDPESAPPPLRALAPIARALEARVEPRSAVPADDLVAAAAGGDMCTALLWRLRRLGLHTPPERLRAVRRLRALTCGTLTAAGIAAALAGPALLALGMRPDGGPQGAGPALCAVLLLTYPFHLHLAWRLLGGLLGAAACGAVAAAAAVAAAPVPYAAAATAAVLYACWFAAHTVSAAARGRPGPRSVAGDRLLAEARTAEGAPAGGADAALRSAALRGLHGLRRDAARGSWGPPERALLCAFAAACGRRVGRPERGLGRDLPADTGPGPSGTSSPRDRHRHQN